MRSIFRLLLSSLLTPFLVGCGVFLVVTEAVARPRLVVVLYPDNNDGRPGNVLVDRGIRSTFAAQSPEPVEICSEFLNVARCADADYAAHLAEFLRLRYANRKVDLVIVGLAPALDFALKYRNQVFPGIPIVFCAIDEGEVKTRSLPRDVIGAPIRMDLAATLNLALRLHPDTERVCVVVGRSPFDSHWEARARQTFEPEEWGLEFHYLTGLSLDELQDKVANLSERTIIYYLHVFEDANGNVYVPAEVLERIASTANAPVYGHVDSYLGKGMIGGRVFSFETAGKNAAQLGLRILAGEKPEQIGIQPTSENGSMFDNRQLRRWRIGEEALPPGSEVRYQDVTFWDTYRWHIMGVALFCVVQGLLILGLLVQRMSRRRAERGLLESREELRVLNGRLVQAQETERRRIARELHDDMSQSLALLSVELDMLGQKPPASATQISERIQHLSAQVKLLSSSVHDLSYQLHPLKLEQLGLSAALRSLGKELMQSHSLMIDYEEQDAPPAIDSETALCLYRIAQEALWNVIKHSGARHAQVKLSGGPEAICLRITDDGCGFDPTRPDGQAGLGLLGMRERLRVLGGTIDIISRPRLVSDHSRSAMVSDHAERGGRSAGSGDPRRARVTASCGEGTCIEVRVPPGHIVPRS